MQQDTPSFLPHLAQRFQSLVWSCLDSDLTKTAVFHAERYYAMDQHNHDSRHLYATALFREGQIYSALCLVNIPPDIQCSGCMELKAKCCTVLGRHRQAQEALDLALQDPSYIPTGMYHTAYGFRVLFCLISSQHRRVVEQHSHSLTRQPYAAGLVLWL